MRPFPLVDGHPGYQPTTGTWENGENIASFNANGLIVQFEHDSEYILFLLFSTGSTTEGADNLEWEYVVAMFDIGWIQAKAN